MNHTFDRSELDPPADEQRQTEEPADQPWLRRAQRDQVEMHMAALDGMLDVTHPVRAIWQAVQELNVSPLLTTIRAIEGCVGRDATDPRILLALWIYATSEGVDSTRASARLCEHHLADRWLCGGVTVYHRLLSKFRSHPCRHGGVADVGRPRHAATRDARRYADQSQRRLLIVSQTADFARGFEAGRAADSGSAATEQRRSTRIESASAGSTTASGRGPNSLRHSSGRASPGVGIAAVVEKAREKQVEARASTTDPDTKIMKFADGGYRPGINVPFSADVSSGIILGEDVSTVGSDEGLAWPMFETVAAHYSQVPS